MNRPYTTLFMLMSVDGKISTGPTDQFDFDRDLPRIRGVKEGLPQYYALERKTDLVSLNTGRVMAKIGINTRIGEPIRRPLTFIILDNKPHLTSRGVSYLARSLKRLILVTANAHHPALKSSEPNVSVIRHDHHGLKKIFKILKTKFRINRITVQSGGTLNAVLFKEKLIDDVSIVVAPIVVGGQGTPTLADGEHLVNQRNLGDAPVMRLKSMRKLRHGYLHLRYGVV